MQFNVELKRNSFRRKKQSFIMQIKLAQKESSARLGRAQSFASGKNYFLFLNPQRLEKMEIRNNFLLVPLFSVHSCCIKVLLCNLKQRKIIAKFQGIGVHQAGLIFLMDTNYSRSRNFIIPICSKFLRRLMIQKLNNLPQKIIGIDA